MRTTTNALSPVVLKDETHLAVITTGLLRQAQEGR